MTSFMKCSVVLLVASFAAVLALNANANRSDRPAGQFLFNPTEKVDPATDCALKTFATEFASFLEPPASKLNWTDLVASGFQLSSVCGGKVNIQPPRYHIDIPPIEKRSCDWSVYVSTTGNDKNSGSFNSPLLTIQRAIAISRSDRNGAPGCIFLRNGTYYQGTFSSSVSSSIGTLALSAIDSGLAIIAYNDEPVSISAGTPLNLKWVEHSRNSAGVIMKAILPDNIDVSFDHFNELYVDGVRAIRAKFPNGDPVFYGRGSSGWLGAAKSWGPLKQLGEATEIHVASPYQFNNLFPTFQLGIGGPADNFNPPHSFWATKKPPGGGGATYIIPTSLVYDTNFSPRVVNWTKPSTGNVFAFHGDGWGSWVFAIGDSTPNTSEITFSRGGFQEARGNSHGSNYYVSNIFEELDDPLEWFVDESTRTIYFMPNMSMPSVIVASQAPCIVSLRGDSGQPVSDVFFYGITFTDSPSTFLRDYEVPSGGDWAIHRGGAVFLTGTTNVVFSKCTFTQLGGNALIISDWNRETTVIQSVFRWLGDSAIIIVGSADGIDGVSNTNQPRGTHIINNLFSEGGAYVKQSAFIFQAVSRSTEIRANIMFNVPRACVNFNDGFGGGHEIHQNLMFNSNRETTDHGPFNSWDRQPYITDAGGLGPSLIPALSQITHNLMFNDYGGINSIDHDDGSAYYNDSLNFLVYSGSKDLFGHHKMEYGNIFIYPDLHPSYGHPVCGSWDSGTMGYPDWGEVWTNNRCIQYGGNDIFAISSCDPKNVTSNSPVFTQNQYYVPKGQKGSYKCGSASYNFSEWQALGMDQGSTESVAPDVTVIVGWGRDLLTPIMKPVNQHSDSDLESS